VETVAGQVAKGFGSMPMGNEWSFPSKTLSYDTTLEAMKRLARRIEKISEGLYSIRSSDRHQCRASSRNT